MEPQHKPAQLNNDHEDLAHKPQVICPISHRLPDTATYNFVLQFLVCIQQNIEKKTSLHAGV